MIVTNCARGWRVIFHQAHSLLAAQLAAALHPRHRPGRWVEVLEAIAFHDDGQQDFSGRNWLNPAGAPLDFTQREYTLEQAQKVAEGSLFKSRRVGLLISLHMSYLYEPIAKKAGRADLKAFCAGQRRQQKRLMKELGYLPEQALAEYGLLRWCDQVSLFLCQEGLPEGGLRIESGAGPGGKNYLLKKEREGLVQMEPWPFEGESLEAFCEARILPRLAYQDDADLLSALKKAEPEELVWRLVPAGA